MVIRFSARYRILFIDLAKEVFPVNNLLCTYFSRMRKDFVDEEAELSGSEYGSDEDLDLDEKDDVMEEELGDMEDLPVR